MKRNQAILAYAIISLMFCLAWGKIYSQSDLPLIQKGTVYVPAYSSIHYGNLINEYALTITLAIHNVDMKNNISISVIDYYNTKGELIQKYILDKKIIIKPMETHILGLKEIDYRGGMGANFIIKWQAEKKINRPLIETIMAGRKEHLGISFTSRGISLSE